VAMSIWRSAARSPSSAARRAASRHDHTAARSSATPTGFAIGAGAVGLVGAAIIAAAIPVADADWRFAVIAIAVGLFAAIFLDQLALGGIAVLAFLISNGFLEDRFGQLAWHGSGDLWRLLLLVTAGAVGLAVGESMRFVANVRAARGVAEFDRADEATYETEPLAARPMSAPQMPDRQMSDRQMSDRQMPGRQMPDRPMPGRQASP